MQRSVRSATAYHTVFECGSVSRERTVMLQGRVLVNQNEKERGIMSSVNYYNQFEDNTLGFFKVVFINNTTGEKLIRGFDSPYFCMRFVNKCRKSKKVTLVSYPYFEYI